MIVDFSEPLVNAFKDGQHSKLPYVPCPPSWTAAGVRQHRLNVRLFGKEPTTTIRLLPPTPPPVLPELDDEMPDVEQPVAVQPAQQLEARFVRIEAGIALIENRLTQLVAEVADIANRRAAHGGN